MVHASLDKCLAVLFASVIILGFTAGIYRAWQIESCGIGSAYCEGMQYGLYVRH